MNAELVERVSSLVGCIYHVPASDNRPNASDDNDDDDANLIFSNFVFGDHIPPCSSTSPNPLLVGSEYAKRLMRAEHLGYACLVGESGESMVPSIPVISLLRRAELDPCSDTPYFMVEYPAYNSNGSQIPLLFHVKLAYVELLCDVCIMKPVDCPFVSTRCMDASFDHTQLTPNDPLFCAFFHEQERVPVMIEGAVSLLPEPPLLHSLIAHFGLELRFRAGIVTNIHGQLLGVHVCDFSIQEGDTIDLNTPQATICGKQVVIKENIDASASPTSSNAANVPKSYAGMPPMMLKQLQERFARSGVRRKQRVQQSRVCILSLACRSFFNKGRLMRKPEPESLTVPPDKAEGMRVAKNMEMKKMKPEPESLSTVPPDKAEGMPVAKNMEMQTQEAESAELEDFLSDISVHEISSPDSSMSDDIHMNDGYISDL